MLQTLEKNFSKIYLFICAFVFCVVAARCFTVPFAHDEVANFYYYIQPGKFLPFLSHVDAMGHFLINLLMWPCYKLFGSSLIALRLPCLAAFVVLCFAVYKFNGLFTSLLPKLVLTTAFIFSFHFIAFFSLCRGYGISMSFLLLALSYYFRFFRSLSFTHFLWFVLFSQLALSANLTLVFVLIITTFILAIVQIRQRLFFRIANLSILSLHFGLILFWVKYALYLQENGALYYGSGDSYWQVTFVSLIETIFLKSFFVNMVFQGFFAWMLVYFVMNLGKGLAGTWTNNFAISFANLLLLIAAFYLLKKVMNVNYPEDRTGLFFYLFFILSFCFMLDRVTGAWKFIGMSLPLFFIVHFFSALNFKIHPWRIYETLPQSFMDVLHAEQDKRGYPVTIAGHRLREFIFGFMNYNSKKKLNHITSPEALQMNCDYAIAYDLDKPWYDKYYTELDEEPAWGFKLLKRKKDLEKKLLYASPGELRFNGEGEFYNAFEVADTTFGSINPLQAEFNFTVEEICVPFNAWLVLGIDDDSGKENVYVRVPLNLIKQNWWETDNFTTCLVSGNIPFRIKRLVAYLWNIDQKKIKIRINSFKLYQLQGEGVTETSKAKL